MKVTTKPAPPPPRIVTIEMSEKEVAALAAILRHVAGGFDGPRSVAAELLRIFRREHLPADIDFGTEGDVSFPDRWPTELST